jgi:ceramide glucosyltransferase
MTMVLSAFTLALIGFTAWRQWMVVRFFRRSRANRLPQGAPPRLVSILQPILSGDPTLPQTLGHNLAGHSTYACEFLWLVDEDDAAGQEICAALIAAHPGVTVRLFLQPAPPQGVNPKTIKLVNGLAAANGDVICVLDDDTMLPDGGLEQCLPYLDRPGAGLAFGLPYQVNFGSTWSSLIALFVNANSLPTYVPYASLHEPATINGMFYALRRSVLDQMGGFSGLEPILADDFAVARRVRGHGLHLVQTPLRHAISTQVPSLRRYLSLMQRWFVFPRESLLRHLPWREQGLVYVLALAPTLLPLLLLLGLLIWPSPLLAALLALYFLTSYAAFLHLDHAYLGHPTPTTWSLIVPVLQVVFPLQILAALLLPQRITWRGHVMQVERGGSFRFVKRRSGR